MAIQILPCAEFGRRQIRDAIVGVRVRDTAWQARIAATIARWSLRTIDAATFGKVNDPTGDSQCSITATDKTLTSVNDVWTAADVGKVIHVQGAGVAGATLETTIASFTAADEVELTDAASTTVAQSFTSIAGLAVWGDAPNVDLPEQSQVDVDALGRVTKKGSGDLGAISQATVITAGSSVARSLAARFTDVRNVRDDGAVADGVTPTVDAVAINAAIVRASTAGGGIVFCPAGTYLVSGVGADRILLKSNVTLVFAPGCILDIGTPAGVSLPLLIDSTAADVENVRILGNGLRVVGDRTTAVVQYGLNINCQNAGDVLDNIEVRDVTFEDLYTDGFTIGGNAGCVPTNIRFYNVRCVNCYRNGASIIQVTGADFYDCQFINTNGASPQAGMDIEADVGLENRDIHFHRCLFKNNSGVGLYWQKGNGTGAFGGSATDCIAEDNSDDGFKLYLVSGITLRGCKSRNNVGGSTDGFTVDSAHDCMVVVCRSEGNGRHGFAISGTIGDVFDACVAEDNAGNGFHLTNQDDLMMDALLSGCNARENAGVGFEISGCSDVSLRSCRAIRNESDGFKLTADTHHCDIGGCTGEENGISGDLGGDNLIIESRSNYNNVHGFVARQALRFNAGTATAGGAATITLPATAVAVDNWYVGKTIRIISGTGAAQSRTITGYVGATRVATVAAWVTPPDATSVYTITGGNRSRYGVRIAAGCTANKVTDCDLLAGGGTLALSDAGTGTVTASANRT